VNNAGMTHDQLLVRMTDEDWDRVLEVNLRSAFLMTRAVSKALVRQKSGGRVINITSTAGAMGNAGQVNYSAAKAGPIGFTKSVDEKVKEIIVEQLGVEEDDVTPSAKFIEDLGADSLDTVELVMALEEHFDIQIPDEDAEKIVTVGDAVQYIKDNS